VLVNHSCCLWIRMEQLY